MAHKPLIIAVVGPTASGKSELAVQLAKKLNGEILSADSRQVYRGMDIGTGKVEGTWREDKYIYKSIRHFGIDIASPRGQYSVARFQKYARKVINDILARDKTPIVCGGTGHWVDAVVFDQNLPAVKPDAALRKKLEQLSTTALYTKLKKLDPSRAANIDPKNPRRLIRALEIVMTTGKPVPQTNATSPYTVVWIGIKTDFETLNKKIDKRYDGWLQQGMIDEIKTLHEHGLPWKRFADFGLEYKFGAQFVQKQITHDEMISLSKTSIKQYAKRQMTWFKRNKQIHWITNANEALKLVKHV